MRKIISILLALGMILALSAVAVPVGAATPCATVAPASSCGGATVTYTITTTAPVTLLAVNDRLSVNFTAGTTFGATFAAADITVNGFAVASFVKTGTHLDFPIPAAVGTLAPSAAIVIVVGKVINPVTAGTKTLTLDYKLNCCAETDFCVATYTILPAISTLDFILDFSPTYPGIAEDFVPPFKACGQNDTGQAFNTTELFTFGHSGNGAAGWSTDYAHSGSDSVKLDAVSADPTSYGLVNIWVSIPLQSLTADPSYWVYEPVVTPNRHPYVNIIIDLDGDLATPDIDALEGVESQKMLGGQPSANTWTQMKEAAGYYDGDSSIDFGAHTYINPATAGNLALWKAYMLVNHPNAKVIRVQLVWGWWAVASDGPVYVDDVSIGGFTYDLKPMWLDQFNLILTADVVGCAPPCTNATMWFTLTKCPVNEVVTFSFNGTWYILTAANVSTNYSLPNVTVMPPPDVTWPCMIHFSSPGDYELCFYLQCPAVPCLAGAQIVATECLVAKVYQWKDAYKLHLYPKWNLISLPLYPFDTDIADVLASIDRLDQLMSVWYFGQCENPAPNLGVWHTEVYNATSGNFTPNTMDIEAGKAYWLRMLHPGDVGYNASLFPVQLWVWGNHAPMPPATSMGYFDVCEGWNMVGFKAPWVAGAPITQANNAYLWNFNTSVIDTVHYGLIYDWVEASQDWTSIVPGPVVLNPGDGYWIPFDGDGEIYPAP